MFSHRSRRPKSAQLRTAWDLVDSGEIPAALRQLRAALESEPLGDVAMVLARAAGAVGFADLQEAAAALAANPEKGRALYDFGYACIERGLPDLAIPALREALRRHPGELGIMRELVAAYEREGRHPEAVETLTGYESRFADWPDRYLLVFNAIMAGDLALADRQHALLPDPADPQWLPAQARQRRMLERAATAGKAAPLDLTDLRGWQFVTGGTVLGTLSPYGFTAGMTGRYAWLQDGHSRCLQGLLRLRTLLRAAEVRPRSVSLLPDRSSLVLGLAAAEVLGLPAEPFAPGREDTVVIAYDLNELAGADKGPEILGQLLAREQGQVLHEHASNWTGLPVITADSVALLHQSVVAPWGAQLRVGEDGEAERSSPDSRPEAEIAAEIVAADVPADGGDEGDGDSPPDTVEDFTRFATAVRGSWLQGDRSGLKSSGPVRSSQFV